MNATLYLPQRPPRAVSVEGLRMPDLKTGFARVPELLSCAPGLVDGLACRPEDVAYSVFGCGGEANCAAMAAVAAVSGVAFDLGDAHSLRASWIATAKLNGQPNEFMKNQVTQKMKISRYTQPPDVIDYNAV